MPATIISGAEISQQIHSEVKAQSDRLRRERGIIPGLAFLLAGDNPASQSYVRMKGKACNEMGFHSVTEQLAGNAQEAAILKLIAEWNHDPRIHGILVQLPLPRHINENRVIMAIDYHKDVDGFHPINAGKLVIGQPCFLPCTPAGIRELLLRSGHDPAGKHVVIAGRSNIVGKPMANILMQKQPGANAIVTIAHTAAADLGIYTRSADILIAAIGKPESITGDMIRSGAVVIDVGINRVPDPSSKTGYRIVGDVHFASAAEKASAITPVPKGVGPMTIAMLMRNTLLAASGELFKDE